MSERRDHTEPDPLNDETTGGVETEPTDGGASSPGDGPERGMSADEAEQYIDLARSGETDVPVGAEGFVEALRAVAAQRDEQRALLQRTAADYQNFQRRARQSERETRELTSAGVVQSLLQVLDFFDMALRQDPETATAQQVLGGVEMIKAEFLRVLGGHGVGTVLATPGEEFDPTRHEAVEQRAGTDVPAGRIIETRSPGYTMGDRIVRPAKVVVAAGAGGGTGAHEDAGEPGGEG